MANTLFSINDITADNLDKIQVIDVSKGRLYGRRFQIQHDGKTSDQLLFSKIFKKIKEISSIEQDPEKLAKIKAFLGEIGKIESNSKQEGCIYTALTWFSRLFSFGSHQKRISALEKYIQSKTSNPNLVPLASSLIPNLLTQGHKCIPDVIIVMMDIEDTNLFKQELNRLINAEFFIKESVFIGVCARCLEVSELERAQYILPYIVSTNSKVSLGNSIANSYLEQGLHEKAFEIAKIIPESQERYKLIPNIARAFLNAKEYDEALSTINLLPSTHSAIINSFANEVENERDPPYFLSDDDL